MLCREGRRDKLRSLDRMSMFKRKRERERRNLPRPVARNRQTDAQGGRAGEKSQLSLLGCLGKLNSGIFVSTSKLERKPVKPDPIFASCHSDEYPPWPGQKSNAFAVFSNILRGGDEKKDVWGYSKDREAVERTTAINTKTISLSKSKPFGSCSKRGDNTAFRPC